MSDPVRTLLYAALAVVLMTVALPAQAQVPEGYPGLLDVLTPKDEAGTYIAGVCDGNCWFGTPTYPYPLPPEGVGPDRVIPAEPIDSCGGFTNADELDGNFALLEWSCPQVETFWGLIDAGARGAVLFYYDPDVSDDDDETLRNIYWDQDALAQLPAVLVTRYRGLQLLAAIEAGEEVTAHMRMNPAVVSNGAGPSEAGLDLSVWPNPSSSPGISLEVERPEAVRLAVYDVLGREAAALHDGLLGAGPQRFAVAGLPAGLYVVRAEVAGQSVTRRMTVIF